MAAHNIVHQQVTAEATVAMVAMVANVVTAELVATVIAEPMVGTLDVHHTADMVDMVVTDVVPMVGTDVPHTVAMVAMAAHLMVVTVDMDAVHQ